MKKTRLLALLLALTMVLSLAACSSKAPTQDTGSSAPQQSTPAGNASTPASDSADSTDPTDSATSTLPQELPPELPVYNADSWKYGYSLKEIGTFADPEGSIDIFQDALYYSDGDIPKFTTYLGQVREDISIAAIEYLGNGLYTLTADDEDFNSVGLVNKDGEVLIPFEACKILWASGATNDEDNRYLEVIYTTGVTENEDECFIYSTDSFISFRPDEDDVMYTGYALVYDTVEKRFVENAKITKSTRRALQACGNSFVIQDETGAFCLYNPDGKLLVQGDAYALVTNGAFIVMSSTGSTFYNELGQSTYFTTNNVQTFISEHGYAAEITEDGYVVIDRFGREILTGYDYVLEENDHVFMVQKGDLYGLVHADGTVILPCESEEYMQYEGYGIYTLPYQVDGEYVDDIITMEGVVATAIPELYNMSAEKDGKVFIFNDGDYTLEIGDDYLSVLAFGLGACDGYLYDLFTGSSLLESQSQYIRIAGSYIYTFDGTNWTVYQLTGPVTAE